MQIIEETSDLSMKDMITQIKEGEDMDQRREQNGDVETLARPSIGKQPKMEEPDSRKDYVPIRNRKGYKELLREVIKASSYLEHVINRRQIFNVEEEAKVLSELSHAAFLAMQYIEEAKKKHEEDKKTKPIEKADDKKTKTALESRNNRPPMSRHR